MKDIRISIGLLDHPKTVKLKRRLGSDAFENLLRLWCFTAQAKPNGVLSDMDFEDIEIAARWQGMAGQFVQALVEFRLLDRDETSGVYSVHEWAIHNPYAAHAEDRSEAARRAGKASAAARAERIKSLESTTVERVVEQGVERVVEQKEENSSTPLPLPSPLPKKKKKAVCPEPETDSGPSQTSPVFLEIPLIKRDGIFPVTEDMVKAWENDFPGIDVRQCLRSLRAWNNAKPERRKTRRGVLKHVVVWLSKEQDRGPRQIKKIGMTSVTEDPGEKIRTERVCQDLQQAKDRSTGMPDEIRKRFTIRGRGENPTDEISNEEILRIQKQAEKLRVQAI